MRYGITLIVLFFVCSLTGQPISGLVVDSDNDPLPSAQIVMKTGSKIVAFAMSDANGKYLLELPAAITDSTILEVRYFGYAPRVFTCGQLRPEILARIVLEDKGVELKEVVVSARALPQVTRGDTISFQTDAYRDGSEDKIEDLLAKLPGVEVAENGKITVQGKQLDRILVDGEDVFDKNYRLLSKNVPANLVSQVDVLSNYSPDELTGDLSGRKEMALNLELDENRKGLVFGEVVGELGNDNYRNVNSNLFHFDKHVKLINFSDYSTTGYASISGDAISAGSTKNEALSTIGSPILTSPASRQRRIVQPKDYLRNNAVGTTQSLLFNLGPVVKNRLIVNADRDRFNLQDNRIREVVGAFTTDTFNLGNDYQVNQVNLWLKNDLKIMTGKNSRLDFNTTLISENTEANAKSLTGGSSLAVSNDTSSTSLQSKPRSLQLSLKFIRRINENMALSLHGTLVREDFNQFQRYQGQVYTDLLGGRGDYGQRMNQRHNNQTLSAKMLHHAGKNKLQYFMQTERLQTETRTGLSLLQSGEQTLQTVNYQISKHSSGLSWHRDVERWTLSSSLEVSLYDFGETSDAQVAISTPENAVVAPQVMLQAKRQINGRSNVALSLSNTLNPITADQAVPLPYLSDQTTLMAGIDTNFLVKTQTAGLNYSYNNSFKQYGYGATINYSRTPNAVWTTFGTEGFLVINRLSPGGNSSMLQSTVYANAYLHSINTGAKLILNYFSFNDQISLGIEPTTALVNSTRLTFLSTTQVTRSVKYGTQINFDRFSNKVQTSTARQQQLYVGQKLILTPGKRTKGIIAYDLYLPQLGTEQTTVQLLSLSFDYKFPDQDIDLGFGVNNLLNQGTITERFVAPNQRNTRSFSLRPRTVYCSARYKF